jgi:divinyl protochlorophyllide a 8-vinyl-reductase
MSTAAGRIGPNAITRLFEALDGVEGKSAADTIARAADAATYRAASPTDMVAEADVRALHDAVRAEFGAARAATLGWIAGQRTADYLLAHRIPGAVQVIMKAAPPRIASAMLMAAIARHAWTFCGSGQFSYRLGTPLAITIAKNPLAKGAASDEPLCAYYAAVFERLFAVLIHPMTRVIETECMGTGAPLCRFVCDWRKTRLSQVKAANRGYANKKSNERDCCGRCGSVDGANSRHVN